MKIQLKWSHNGLWTRRDCDGFQITYVVGVTTCKDNVEGSKAWFIQITFLKVLLLIGFRG